MTDRLSCSPVQYTNLADDTYTLSVRAVDKAGNVDSSPAVFTWTVDTTGPDNPSISSPADGFSTNAATIDISGTATNDAVKVQVLADGQALGNPVSVFNGAWSITGADISSLGDGAHKLTAIAYDLAGNAGTESTPAITINIDRTPPDTPSNLKSSGGTAVIPDVTITGSAEADSTVNVYDEGNNLLKSGTATTGGSFSIVVSGLADGSHTFTIKAKDAAGSEGNGATITVTVNTTSSPPPPPAPIITSPPNDFTLQVPPNSPPPFVEVRGTAEPGTTSIKIYDGTTVIATATTDTSGNWGPVSVPLAVGTHTITATTTNAANFESGHSNQVVVTITVRLPPQ